MPKLSVFIVEDAALREGLKLMVAAQPDMQVVGEADDLTSAIDASRRSAPDVVVMDAALLDRSEIAATQAFKRHAPGSPLLLLTRTSDRTSLRELFRAGVSGYVLRQSPPSALIGAIRVLAAGGRFMDPAITNDLVRMYFGKDAFDELSADPADALSRREVDVMRLLAWGYSNKDIAARLSLSVKTIESHKSNAMRKLDIDSRVALVRLARIKGWLDREP